LAKLGNVARLPALRGDDGGAVGLQAGHKVRGQFVRDKLRDERGLRGELLQEIHLRCRFYKYASPTDFAAPRPKGTT
jgi:hypothetical protein